MTNEVLQKVVDDLVSVGATATVKDIDWKPVVNDNLVEFQSIREEQENDK